MLWGVSGTGRPRSMTILCGTLQANFLGEVKGRSEGAALLLCGL